MSVEQDFNKYFDYLVKEGVLLYIPLKSFVINAIAKEQQGQM